MSDSGLGQFDDDKLSDETRREISEFVERSAHYSSIEEFLEDAANYQIELFQQTTDAAQQPIRRTNSVVLRLLTTIDSAVVQLHQTLLRLIRQYISITSRSEDRSPSQSKFQSRTTAAEKMELYQRDECLRTHARTYQQRATEMRDLQNQENLSAADIEQVIRETEDS